MRCRFFGILKPNIRQYMPFEWSVREWLYLGASLLGSAWAVFFVLIFRGRYLERSSRSRRWLAGSLLFSLSFASFSMAFIVSEGKIIFDVPLLLVALGVFAAFFAGALLPRLFGFPLIVAASSALVLFSWSFLVYPAVADGSILGRVRFSLGSGIVRVWFAADADIVEIPMSDRSAPLRFEILKIDFDQRFPIIGGSSRCSLLRVVWKDSVYTGNARKGLAELFGDPAARSFFIVPGVRPSFTAISVPKGGLESGVRLDLVLSKDGFRFSM